PALRGSPAVAPLAVGGGSGVVRVSSHGARRAVAARVGALPRVTADRDAPGVLRQRAAPAPGPRHPSSRRRRAPQLRYRDERDLLPGGVSRAHAGHARLRSGVVCRLLRALTPCASRSSCPSTISSP